MSTQTGSCFSDLASRFKKSPLCTVSLSSKELFHSNFLAWLLERNEHGFATALFGEEVQSVEQVEREKHNYDLLIESEAGRIIVENKVKSIPDAAQIREYLTRKNTTDRFVLLSLIPPSCEITQEFKNSVKFLSYEDLHKQIESYQSKSTDSYHKSLLEDYALLLETLLKVKSIASIEGGQPLSFERSMASELRGIRLFDVAQKIRYGHLQRHCSLVLDKHPLPIKSDEVGLTHAQGLLTYRWEVVNTQIHIGVQIQGGQYRRFVETIDDSDPADMADSLSKAGLWVFGKNKKNALLRFKTKHGHFRYRYERMKDDMTASEIAKKLKDDFDHLFGRVGEVEKILRN